MTPATHRLSDIRPANPRRFDTCQYCGHPDSRLTRWQEHDHNDRPENIVLGLCKNCAETLIERHDRLYTPLNANAPWPGCMAICLDCKLRHGNRCTSGAAKANGGGGVMLTVGQPMTAMVHGVRNGRRTGWRETLWPYPPRACKQREI